MTVAVTCRRRLLAGLAFSSLLAACGSSDPPRLFTLAPRPAAAPATSQVRIAVKSVEVAKYLDRPQIVRHTDSFELQAMEQERWGESLRDMVTRVLVENLSLRLRGSQVVSESSPVSMTPDVTVEVDISRFSGEQSGVVSLDARWAAQRGRGSPTVHWERIQVTPRSGTTTDLVAAMSDALGQLSDRIAQGLTS